MNASHLQSIIQSIALPFASTVEGWYEFNGPQKTGKKMVRLYIEDEELQVAAFDGMLLDYKISLSGATPTVVIVSMVNAACGVAINLLK